MLIIGTLSHLVLGSVVAIIDGGALANGSLVGARSQTRVRTASVRKLGVVDRPSVLGIAGHVLVVT